MKDLKNNNPPKPGLAQTRDLRISLHTLFYDLRTPLDFWTLAVSCLEAHKVQFLWYRIFIADQEKEENTTATMLNMTVLIILISVLRTSNKWEVNVTVSYSSGVISQAWSQPLLHLIDS